MARPANLGEGLEALETLEETNVEALGNLEEVTEEALETLKEATEALETLEEVTEDMMEPTDNLKPQGHPCRATAHMLKSLVSEGSDPWSR